MYCCFANLSPEISGSQYSPTSDHDCSFYDARSSVLSVPKSSLTVQHPGDGVPLGETDTEAKLSPFEFLQHGLKFFSEMIDIHGNGLMSDAGNREIEGKLDFSKYRKIAANFMRIYTKTLDTVMSDNQRPMRSMRPDFATVDSHSLSSKDSNLEFNQFHKCEKLMMPKVRGRQLLLDYNICSACNN